MYSLVQTHMHIYTYIFLFCQVRGPGNKNISVAMRTPSAQIILSKLFDSKGTGVLREVADSGTGQEVYKMNLEHHMMLESEKAHNKQVNKKQIKQETQ